MAGNALTIAERSKRCLDLFSQGADAIRDLWYDDASSIQNNFQDECIRFKLWASNISVFADVHASLDFRLREFPDIANLFLRQLDTIEFRLDQFHKDVTETQDRDTKTAERQSPIQPLATSDNETSNFKDWDTTEMLQSIHKSIGWLHRLSKLVRKASFGDQNGQAHTFQLQDSEGRESEQWTEGLRQDYKHIVKRNTEGLEDYLANRLVETMIMRHKRILHRRSRHISWDLSQMQYRPKRTQSPSSSPQLHPREHEIPLTQEPKPLKSGPRPTSERSATPVQDKATTVNVATYGKGPTQSRLSRAISAPLKQQDQMLIPPLPRAAKEGKDFVCPYCCLILRSHEFRNQNAWANHVKKDLDAYVCVFKECDDPSEIYSSNKEWLSHMRNRHRMRWQCFATDHKPLLYDCPEDFEQHMKTDHAGTFPDDQLPLIVEISRQPITPILEHCPFCSETAGNLEEHVGQHLQEFALHSLPWPDYAEEESQDGSRQLQSDITSCKKRTRETVKDDQGSLPPGGGNPTETDETPNTEPRDLLVRYEIERRKALRNFHLGDSNRTVGDTPFNTEVDNCLNDLYLTDPRNEKEHIVEIKGGLRADSYRWVLHDPDFQWWHDDDQGRLLWIRGGPGKGKTMLLAGIIDKLEREIAHIKEAEQPTSQATVLSYFFCQGSNLNLNTATAVLRGLIFVLAIQHPSLARHLSKKYKYFGRKLFEDDNAFVGLSEILSDMLRDSSIAKAYIVIDALDECETGLPQLLELINETALTPHVKWLVSSRNRHDIKQHLKPSGSQTRLILGLGAKVEYVSHAISTYFDEKVSQLTLLHKFEPHQAQVEEVLRRKAEGNFLWVALVVQELKEFRAMSVLEALNETPTGLENLFRRIFHRIQQLQMGEYELCRLALSAAILAYRPLHLLELGVLCGLPEEISCEAESIQEIIRTCGSFLTVRNGYVYIIHQSAKDYLRSERALIPPSNHTKTDSTWQGIVVVLYSGRPLDHRGIYLQSLAVMRKLLRRDIYNLRHPGISIDDIKVDPDPLASAQYAVVYWIDHLCDCYHADPRGQGGDLEDGGPVHQFLEDYLLYWIEASSLCRAISHLTHSIEKLVGLLKTVSNESGLLSLTLDAQRLLLLHGSIIKNFPLQIYTSALVFSPTNSLVRKLFKTEEPMWVWMGRTLYDFRSYRIPVSSVTFSPDGRLITSASYDNTFIIQVAATGELIDKLECPGALDHLVAFSPDGKFIALTLYDKTIDLWDTNTGKLRQIFKSHSDKCHVQSAVFSPDGRLIASALGDKTIKLWDTATGVLTRTLEGRNGSAQSLAFSPDGSLIASLLDDNTIELLDRVTGVLARTLEGHTASAQSVAFSPDGRLLASALDDNIIELWDTVTGKLICTCKGLGGSLKTISFDTTGRYLFTDTSSIEVYSIIHADGKVQSQPWEKQQCGYGLNYDKSWITWSGHKVLWLPPEYRSSASAISRPVPPSEVARLAIGNRSGRVILISFLGAPPGLPSPDQ